MPPTKLNPWWSMWIYPRATIRRIIDSGSTREVSGLAAMYGVAYVLNRAEMRGVPSSMSPWVVLALALVAGPIAGFISIYIGGAILGWVGRRLGGIGSTTEVRTAMAWASVPRIEAMVLWIPSLAIFGGEVFYNQQPSFDAWADAQPWIAWPSVLMLVFIAVTAMIWGFIVTLKYLAEAHQFSAWRALATLIVLSSPFILMIIAALVASVVTAIQRGTI